MVTVTIEQNKFYDFGFLPDNPCVEKPTDTFEEMQAWKNDIPKRIIVKHIERLKDGLICGSLASVIDVVTGEKYPAGIYRDGPFTFAIDVLRYLKRGDIHGVPKEYEDYLKETYHLGE